MMKNKRGAMFFGIAIGIFIFAMGVLFIPFIANDITTFRVDMDCTNSSISDGTKLTCLLVDLTVPYWIWFFISMCLGLIIGSRI